MYELAILLTQFMKEYFNSFDDIQFFPGPLAFCKKAVERVNSEKNILNSSVECVEWSGVEWSGVVFFRKSHVYVHH